MMNAVSSDNEKKRYVSRVVIGAAAVFMSLMFFVMPDTVSASVIESLSRCGVSVIPVIFPFSVASGLFSESGAYDRLDLMLSRPFYRLFGMTHGACAVLSGLLFGFPIGAVTASRLYSDGKITKSQCERLLCFACTASPPYPVLAVGRALFGSTAAGVIIWCSQAVISLMSGVILNIISPLKNEEETSFIEQERVRGDVSHPRALTGSVVSASNVIINVCGAIVFFSLLSSIISEVLSFARGGIYISLLSSSLFEFTSGCASAAAAYADGIISFPAAMFFSGFAVGSSGLSVMCQTVSVVNKRVNVCSYIISKLITGAITGAISYAAAKAGTYFWADVSSGAYASCEEYAFPRTMCAAATVIALIALFSAIKSKRVHQSYCKNNKKDV